MRQNDGIEVHSLQSTLVAQEFEIRVLLPMSRDSSERFPVVYTTDSDDYFGGLAALGNVLQLLGDTPRFILVGIGYGDALASRLLRWRDLLPRGVRERFHETIGKMTSSPAVGGGVDLQQLIQTTDASNFLEFIRTELLPFISERYPVIYGDNNYYGFSAGATFGLHALFTAPDTFKRYILGSPASSYDGDNFGVEMAREFLRSGRQINAEVFLSVGELEEFSFPRNDLVSGYYMLAKFLRSTCIAGLQLKTQVFPQETHATSWTLAFSHGLKALFGPVIDTPYWLESLK